MEEIFLNYIIKWQISLWILLLSQTSNSKFINSNLFEISNSNSRIGIAHQFQFRN